MLGLMPISTCVNLVIVWYVPDPLYNLSQTGFQYKTIG